MSLSEVLGGSYERLQKSALLRVLECIESHKLVLTTAIDIMLSRLFLVCSLTLSWSSTGYAEKTNNIAPTAVTRNGTYYGIHSTTWKQDFFFGVPYVQPPVGQLRYRAPTALNTSWTGTRNATQIGYECIGYAVRF
jgi:hypothetical protein